MNALLSRGRRKWTEMGGIRKTRERGVSRVIMGGCRHSLPSVEELRKDRKDRMGNILDGAFGAEN